MGMHISLHSSNWNKNETSEKKNCKKKKPKHLAEPTAGDQPGERETLITETANEG